LKQQIALNEGILQKNYTIFAAAQTCSL